MGKTRDLIYKIRDTKGIFHTNMCTIKDRNGMDLTKAEDIKIRWQEHTEKWKWKSLYHIRLCDSMDCPWNSPGQNTGVGRLSLLQGIFPTQESNPGLLHCSWIHYQLSHKGSSRILEWLAYPFSSRLSRPRNRSRVSCIALEFFTDWAIRETKKFI